MQSRENEFACYTSSELPARRRVSFSSTNEVHFYEADLKHDDVEFLRIARNIIAKIEVRARGQSSRMTKLFKWIVNERDEELDSRTMSRFIAALQYRLQQLPEYRFDQSMEIDQTLRRLLRMVHDSGGWSSILCDKFEQKRNGCIGQEKNWSHTVFVSQSVDELSMSVRDRISRDMSAETITSEIMNLTRIRDEAEEADVREYCRKEIVTLRCLLDDMGYLQISEY